MEYRPFLHDITFIDGFPYKITSLMREPIYDGTKRHIRFGSVSGNLWGATRAARRIATDITGVELVTNGS